MNVKQMIRHHRSLMRAQVKSARHLITDGRYREAIQRLCWAIEQEAFAAGLERAADEGSTDR